jgi:hypothetical protein
MFSSKNINNNLFAENTGIKIVQSEVAFAGLHNRLPKVQILLVTSAVGGK